MTRPAFLIVAVPSILGAFGHANFGDRDIFPKITAASTGLSGESIRVLRLAWHTLGLTIRVILTALGFKPGALSKSDRLVVTGISVWFAILGIADHPPAHASSQVEPRFRPRDVDRSDPFPYRDATNGVNSVLKYQNVNA
jgi:hypothetical protein